MADDTTGPTEPKMTPRERRAANAKGGMSPQTKKFLVRGVIVLVALGAVYGIYASVTSHTKDSGCPTHWHATFGIYIPSESGSPEQVDFGSPRSASGRSYYELGGFGGMTLAVHMHQSGSESSGAAIDKAQLHMEQAGVCTGVQDVFDHLEAHLTKDSIKLSGGHAQVGQDGTWRAEGNQTLRFWLHANEGSNIGGWSEKSFGQLKDYQLKDGESILVAFGDFSPFQIENMQNSVPAPISRDATAGEHSTHTST